MTPVDPPAYVEPSRRSRRNFLLLVGGLGLVGFLLAWVVEPQLFVHLKLLPVCEQIGWLRGLLLGALLLCLLLAALLLAYLVSLRRAGRFPITDRWVLRRTRISRGKELLVLQLVLAFALVVLLGLAVLVGQLLWGGRMPVPQQCQAVALLSPADLVNALVTTTSLARPGAIWV